MTNSNEERINKINKLCHQQRVKFFKLCETGEKQHELFARVLILLECNRHDFYFELHEELINHLRALSGSLILWNALVVWNSSEEISETEKKALFEAFFEIEAFIEDARCSDFQTEQSWFMDGLLKKYEQFHGKIGGLLNDFGLVLDERELKEIETVVTEIKSKRRKNK